MMATSCVCYCALSPLIRRLLRQRIPSPDTLMLLFVAALRPDWLYFWRDTSSALIRDGRGVRLLNAEPGVSNGVDSERLKERTVIQPLCRLIQFNPNEIQQVISIIGTPVPKKII